jgi:hypothetical protein
MDLPVVFLGNTCPWRLNMGLSYHPLKFLLEAGRASGCFTSVLTIGRQELQHFDPQSLASLLTECGYPAGADQAEAILRDEGGFCEPLFRFLGARRIDSIDYSSYEGASIVHDMNQPVPDHLASSYTAVIDSGCLEHIFNFPIALGNCMRMLAVGGEFLSITIGNNYMGHGFYQFSPELFFRVFDRENGFEMERTILFDPMGGAHWYEVSDPKRVGRRVEAVTRGPIDLFVQARKVAEVPLYTAVPQQSDYADAWDRAAGGTDACGPAPVHRRDRKPGLRTRDRLKQIAPGFVIDLYRRARDKRAMKQFKGDFFKIIK